MFRNDPDRKKPMRKQIILTLLLTMSLAACVAPNGDASTAPSATATVSPTASETPTQTPTPEATATPTETPTPEVTPTETFAPMELGTPEHFAQCKIEDYNGRIQAQEQKNMTPFSKETPDGKFIYDANQSYFVYYIGPVEISSNCRIDGYFGDTKVSLAVIGLHIKVDGVDRFIHLAYPKDFVQNKVIPIAENYDTSTIKIGIVDPYTTPGIAEASTKPGSEWMIALVNELNKEKVGDQMNQIRSDGKVLPTSMEDEILFGLIGRP